MDRPRQPRRPRSIAPARPAEQAAGELVSLARQTGTRVTFIEDPKLLAKVEGVGAFLRYKLPAAIDSA